MSLNIVALDTGVIAESVNTSGEFYRQATVIFDAIKSGSLTALVSPLTVSESHYVLWRIYDKLAMKNAEQISRNFCEYIYYHPNIRIVETSLDLLLEAGRIKRKYSLALSDCFVLAVSKMNKCKAVFRHKEDEMEAMLKDLNKEFNLLFLEDYAA